MGLRYCNRNRGFCAHKRGRGQGMDSPATPGAAGRRLFLCVAAHCRWDGFRPAERARAFRSPLQPSGVPCRWLFLRGGALPLGEGFRPAGRARAFRSPLQPSESPFYTAGSVRGVALDVQESRPALPRVAGVVVGLEGFARGSADRQACPPASDPSHHPPACAMATGEIPLSMLDAYSW